MKKWMKFAGAAFSLVLAVGLGVGGTLAWLTDTTGPVVNTFTAGNIELTLDETNVDGQPTDSPRDTSNTYELMPGRTIEKDPVVHVAAGSEDCIVFVKVINELSTIQEHVTLSDGSRVNMVVSQILENGWVPLEGVADVYYYETVVPQNQDAVTDLPVFESFKVMDNVNDKDASRADTIEYYVDKTIEVTAYAVQAEGLVADELDQTEALGAWNANFKD